MPRFAAPAITQPVWPGLLLAAIASALAGCPSEPESAGRPDAGLPAPAATPEAEPNDDSNKAQQLAGPGVVEGTTSAKDVDWYRVALPAAAAGAAPVLLRLEASGDADLTLELYDADKNKLLHASAAPAKSPEVIDGVAARGPLFLRIASSGSEAPLPYRLLIEQRAQAPGAELEPDDRAVDASPLALGTPASGTISFEEDQDFFRLDLPPPAAPDQRRALRLELSGVTGLRPILAVLDADQAPLGEARGRETGAPVSFRNLSVRPDARLPLFVVVKSSFISKGRRSAAPDVPYALTATLEAAAEELEEEPNDDPARATAIPAGAKGRLGFLAPAGDVDHFSITVEKAQIARLDLSGVDRVDLQLEVIDPAREKDEVLQSANDGGVKEGEVLPGVYLAPGTTTVRIQGAAKKVDGKWVRAFENPEQTYTLQVTTRDAVEGDEREPNGRPEQATELASGTTGRGFVHPRKDVDLWKVVVPPGGTRPLSATLSGLTKVDVGLYLRGGTPDAKGELPVIASSDKAKETSEEKLVAQVEAGTYWLEVKDTRGGQSNWTDAYKLEVVVGE